MIGNTNKEDDAFDSESFAEASGEADGAVVTFSGTVEFPSLQGHQENPMKSYSQ